MNSLFGMIKAKSIVSTVVAGFVSVVVYFGGLNSDQAANKKTNSGNVKHEMTKVEQESTGTPNHTEKLTKAKIIKKKVPYKGNDIKRIKEEVEHYMKFALTDSASCKKFLNKEIRDPDYIDPASAKFNSSSHILVKIDTISNAVVSDSSTEAYHFIEKLIYHKKFYEQKLEVSNIRKYLAKIEVCRDPRLFNFLISSVEAASDRKWKSKTKTQLYRKISQYFIRDLDNFPSTSTLAYSTQFLKGLVLHGLIDESFREEILTLMNEVMEHQMYVVNSLTPENNNEDNLMVLQEDFSQRKFYGEKVRSLFLKIDNQLN